VRIVNCLTAFTKRLVVAMNPKSAMLFLMTVCGLHILLVDSILQAQDNDLVIANITGKLEAIVGYQIKLKSEDDKDYMAVVDPQDTTFKYVGTAELKFLSQGMLVRFSAPFNQAGSTDPIKELEIFNQVRERRMRPEQIQEITPGVYPIAKNDKDIAPPKGYENYRIVGRIGGIKDEKMQIAAGGRNIVVSIDPAVVIHVTSIDTTYCKEGDEITVSGLTVSAQPNWIRASTITVTGANPLAPVEVKARATRGRTKPEVRPEAKPAKSEPAAKK
jgi:hypothetical protein